MIKINDIINFINNGETNSEIIKKILSYISSSEYENNRITKINEKEKLLGTTIDVGDSNVVLLKDGFIKNDEVIDHHSGKITWSDGYIMDDESIYIEIINYIRENISQISSRGGLTKSNIKEICTIIRKYFSLTEESKYYEVCIYLKKWFEENKNIFKFQQSNSDLFIRYQLPEIINSYKASDFNEEILEYTKLFINNNFYFNYGLKNGNNPFKNIRFDENQLFSPVKISEIKHTGAAACTEYSMVLQNCLAILGYDVYMIGGKENENGHNYNVVRDLNGKYRVFDIGMLVYGEELVNIDEPNELLYFGDRTVNNTRGNEIIYSSEYITNDIDNLTQKKR